MRNGKNFKLIKNTMVKTKYQLSIKNYNIESYLLILTLIQPFQIKVSLYNIYLKNKGIHLLLYLQCTIVGPACGLSLALTFFLKANKEVAYVGTP